MNTGKQTTLFIMTAAAIALSGLSKGQVGINNNTPKATLDITAKTTDGSKPEGLIAPRLTGDQIKAADGQYGIVQAGTIIYATAPVTTTSTKTVNVTAAGYYYFDGSVRQKMTGAAATDATTTAKGIVQLAGDLSGTAASPNIANSAVTSAKIADGTVANADLASGAGGIYKGDGSLSGNTTVTQGTNTLTFSPTAINGFSVDGPTFSVDAANHRIGIGTAAPTSVLEIKSTTTNTSGLKFTNLNSTSPSTSNASTLGVDNMGNVVVQSAAPIQTKFKSFSIDSNVASNSLVSIGSLEFRFAGTCTNGNSYIQARSVSGTNNTGIFHGAFIDNQSGSGFVNVVSTAIPTSFTDLTSYPLNCVQDGHAQFSFFSYTDRTFYRVNIHIADGDSLGFGALGYIYVEYQK